VHEAAIVFELGYADRYDAVVLVTAPEAVRLARVMTRDGAAAEQVQARMARQWPDTQKIPLATFVIENDGRPLEPQLEALWARLSAPPGRP
jgi:dephospho-CoA kinase